MLFQPNRLGWLCAALTLCVVSACASARHIREAQDAFNRAAAAENYVGNTRPEGPADALAISTSSLADYRMALNLIDEELQENADALKQDQLLGTALMLKALCLWRIEDLASLPPEPDLLRQTLQEVEANAAELGTRDRVLAKALPGLRDHDRGRRAASIEKAREHFGSALTSYADALAVEQLPDDHSICAYIYLCELKTLRAWKAWIEPLATTGVDGLRRYDEERAVIEKLRDEKWARVPELWKRNQAFCAVMRDICKSAGWSPLPVPEG